VTAMLRAAKNWDAMRVKFMVGVPIRGRAGGKMTRA